MDTIGARIAFLRNAMGLQQEELAAALSTLLKRDAGGGRPTSVTRVSVTNWENDTTGISQRNAAALAELTGASLDWLHFNRGAAPAGELLFEIGKPFRRPPKPKPPRGRQEAGAEVTPLYGVVAAGELGRGGFILTPEPVEFIAPPPGLADEADLYALTVKGTSMLPVYADGERVFVSPHRTIRQADIVIVQERDSANGQPQSFIKQYDHETPAQIVTYQFNPPGQSVLFVRQHVMACHRVFTRREEAARLPAGASPRRTRH
jgi:phage repressor protein C with HTH and peptisase S24 domain